MDQPPVDLFLKEFYQESGVIDLGLLKNAVFSLRECAHCGLVFQEHIPNDSLMEILYEKWIDPSISYATHAKNDGLRRHAIYAQEILQVIGYFHRNPPEIACLDFGMGWGKWAQMARAFGCQCDGCELSPARIAHAQANGITVIRWEEIPRKQYDFINADQVLEHLPDPLGTLRHLVSALKPSGLIHISVPDGSDIKRRLAIMDWSAPKGSKNSLNPVSPLEHINCFPRRSLVAMAEAAGLQLFKMPLSNRYRFSIAAVSLRFTARNLILPLQQDLFGKGTDLLFRPVPAQNP
jgi:2-polyprenyl-3-methyl-5-hydroxy-6-metoxy-1,4-benzoquinol methylase